MMIRPKKTTNAPMVRPVIAVLFVENPSQKAITKTIRQQMKIVAPMVSRNAFRSGSLRP